MVTDFSLALKVRPAEIHVRAINVKSTETIDTWGHHEFKYWLGRVAWRNL